MRFRATIDLAGKAATGIRVPSEVVERLGAGGKPPVRVTIGTHTYRRTVAARGDAFVIPVSGENRKAAGVSAGDEVDVELEPDTEPRDATVPPDFAAALDASANAREGFERLSYSQRLRHVLAIEQAKAPETRDRRIAKAIESLREGHG